MQLRRWQEECASLAVHEFESNNPNFFCLATPGAGKTIMAAEVTKQLLKRDMIDFVVCFSPSRSISLGIESTFSFYLKERFDGLMGSIGRSLTYQSMVHLNQDFWQVISENRILVVFDEIHHCEGLTIHDANAWGYEVITNIKDRANYTLSLSGTPWRSNRSPIVLSKYSDPDQEIQCDYIYGFRQAIKENVCRKPTVVLVDNDHISVTKDDNNITKYSSLRNLLQESKYPYQSILQSELALKAIISRAKSTLDRIRIENSDAAGLIVASSVEHAHKIRDILCQISESSILVSYRDHNASTKINDFREGSSKWIISIGMISEGTDIPRLQVCCHLSRVKTELHFRQVLGRILRTSNSNNQEAWLYTFAEPNLSEFAHRLEDEIPNSKIVFEEKIKIDSLGYVNETEGDEILVSEELPFSEAIKISADSSNIDFAIELENETTYSSTTSFEFVGEFREQVIESFISPF